MPRLPRRWQWTGVTENRSGVTVRQVQYAYYDGSDGHGSLGDLKSATVLDGGGNTLDTSYYRYGGGHLLKYAFGPAADARLVAAVGGDPSSASDTQVAPYADKYFEYDTQQRVTKEIAQGAGSSSNAAGLGTFTFAYVTSTNVAGYNSWQVKTTETLPDGNQNIVYTNAYGEVMLSVYHDTTGERPVPLTGGTSQRWDRRLAGQL